MATCRQITTLALQKLGVVGAGREPRTADAASALDALQAMYGSWIASGAFGRLHSVVPTGTYYTPQGSERILRNGSDLLEVTLPELVSDRHFNDYGRERCGSGGGYTVRIETIAGETVVTVEPAQPVSYATPPRDGQAVVIATPDQGTLQTWLYDGTLGRWQNTSMLQLDSEAPRSEADRQGLASCLAIELSDQYASELQPNTIAQASRFKQEMTTRYGFQRQTCANAGSYF